MSSPPSYRRPPTRCFVTVMRSSYPSAIRTVTFSAICIRVRLAPASYRAIVASVEVRTVICLRGRHGRRRAPERRVISPA